jgi:hypothetical protein
MKRGRGREDERVSVVFSLHLFLFFSFPKSHKIDANNSEENQQLQNVERKVE